METKTDKDGNITEWALGADDVDTVESRLRQTLFVVEATSYEQFCLWQDHAAASASRRFPAVRWVEINPGWGVTVGHLDRRPCVIQVCWARIEGRLVMFWHQCSQVCDSVQAEAWIDAYFDGKWDGGRPARCDAQNFGLCLQAIREANCAIGPKAAVRR